MMGDHESIPAGKVTERRMGESGNKKVRAENVVFRLSVGHGVKHHSLTVCLKVVKIVFKRFCLKLTDKELLKVKRDERNVSE
jgi:hypothetical protein